MQRKSVEDMVVVTVEQVLELCEGGTVDFVVLQPPRRVVSPPAGILGQVPPPCEMTFLLRSRNVGSENANPYHVCVQYAIRLVREFQRREGVERRSNRSDA